MSDQSDEVARTKIDFLYRQVLGEVHDVVTRVESIKETVPAAAAAAAERLKTQTAGLENAALKLRDGFITLSKKVDEHSKAAINAATAVGKAEIRETAVEAAKEAIQTTVGKEVGDAVQSINDAAASLTGKAKQAKDDIEAKADAMTWGARKLVAVVAVTGLVTGLAAGIAGGLIVRAGDHSSANLSADDQHALKTGRAMVKAWPTLTQRERDHINELTKADQ